MKKILLKIFIALLVLTTVFSVTFSVALATDQPTGAGVQPIATNQGNATISSFLGFLNPVDIVNNVLTVLVTNIIIPLAGSFLGFCGFLFDGAISISLNIKDFIDSTPTIFSTWKILRDLSGLFFIFYLLYAAAQLILSRDSAKSYGSLIKNIIVAGILVNFSFSIISLGIDASNIVSLTIYNAMNPTHKIIKINPDTKIESLIANNEKDGISSIFMNSLRIQQVYDTSGNRLGSQLNDPIKIALVGLAGAIMMVTTGLSFLIAAFSFIARTVILIFLLAFSSLYFTSSVIPEIRKHLGFFTTQLKAQLLFMPAYMLLTYVGLSVVNGSQLLANGVISNTVTLTGINWLIPYIIILINFAIVIAILNMPLFAGLAMGGWATSLTSGWAKKFDALTIWKNIGSWSKTAAWNQTGSRIASGISSSNTLKDLTANKYLGGLASQTLKASRKLGESYNKNFESKVKARTDFANSLGHDQEIVNSMQTQVGWLKTQLSDARVAGNADLVKKFEAKIRDVESGIENEKNRRKVNYAKKLKTRTQDTLWMKLAADKEAGNKIQNEINKAKLDKEKEKLKKAQDDIKNKTDQLQKNRDALIDSGKVENGDQILRREKLEREVQELKIKERRLTSSVAEIENLIEE